MATDYGNGDVSYKTAGRQSALHIHVDWTMDKGAGMGSREVKDKAENVEEWHHWTFGPELVLSRSKFTDEFL